MTQEHPEKETFSLTIEEMLNNGVHFGHETHRWNPAMRPYIFRACNGIHIIDLAKTLHQLREAVAFLEQLASKRKSILFVGTKKAAREAVRKFAELCGEFYTDIHWQGGLLTNAPTVRHRVKELDRLDKLLAEQGEGATKKEIVLMTKKRFKLDRSLSGVRGMRKLPDLLIIVDPGTEHIAVKEAQKLSIPIMAIVDTNNNPHPIDYVIAGNDDAVKSIQLILSTLSDAVLRGKKKAKASLGKGEISLAAKYAAEPQKELPATEARPQ